MQKADTISPVIALTRQRGLKGFLYHYWLLSHWLSLDVALGAVISSSMVCKLLGAVPLPIPALTILGVTVWIIYTLDHVWDVQSSGGLPLSARRLFHWKYRKELNLVAGVLICLMGIGVWMYLPLGIVFFGLGLGALVAMYLWMVNKLGVTGGRRIFHKEPIVALLYTAGLWGVALLTSSQVALQPVLICLCLLFTLLALQNLCLFSLYEHAEDIGQAQRSLAQTYGVRRVKIFIISLFILFALVAMYTGYISRTFIEQKVLLTLVVMALVLGLLFVFPQLFKKCKIYRPIGDSVFLLPAWLLFM